MDYLAAKELNERCADLFRLVTTLNRRVLSIDTTLRLLARGVKEHRLNCKPNTTALLHSRKPRH